MDINIILQLFSFNDENIHIILNGTMIYHNHINYIVSVHKGLPIIKITISGIDIDMDNIIKCKWNDLLFIPLTTELLIKLSDTFVFKHFVKKQMDTTNKYYVNNIMFKFIENVFLPISMIPNNPIIMYNIIKTVNPISLLAGSPIYTSNNKLCSIVLQTNDNIIYSIPINYIFMALNRTKISNNTIFTLNEDISQIYKINNFKIVCDKIYCRMHKTYIPIETYIATNGDIHYNIDLKNNIESQKCVLRKKGDLGRFVNHIIDINSMIIIDINIVKLTSGFIHWLKIVQKNELIVNIIKKIENGDDIIIQYMDRQFVLN